MSRLIIMRGLPASGKSTRAKEIVKEFGNVVRINRDSLRKMLHFDTWSGVNEGLTIKAQKALVEEFIANSNRVVIIDDTNLNLGTLESWKQYAKGKEIEFKVITMDTPIAECIKRDKKRENGVGSDVIINMARKTGLYNSVFKDILVDIDGTLADLTHRLHFVEKTPKDWKGFFAAIPDDAPRLDVINKVKKLSKLHNIVLVSARPEAYRAETKAWLKKYKVPYETLIMRPNGDSRPDDEVKQDMLKTYFKKDMIEMVIDDRPRVIRMWQANGLKVEDVGKGVEF